MSTNAFSPTAPATLPTAVTACCGHWTVHHFQQVTSTNLVAQALPVWNAVRADTQNNGRGRFQRFWVSDEGGLWLSAVVPLAPVPILRRALPLAAALAVCGTLHELGISGFRLRWPNDVMVGDKKLAGLLIDQFAPGLAVIGIGINVSNRPEQADPTLVNRTIRLAELLAPPPALGELTARLLAHLRSELRSLDSAGPSDLFARVNRFWHGPKNVELDLDGPLRRGLFTGVDYLGRLALVQPSGETTFHESHEVRHLTET